MAKIEVRSMRRLLDRVLDDYRLKTKFYMVYVICVVIPILVTNAIVLGSVVTTEETSRRQAVENLADSVEENIQRTLNAANSLTILLFTDEGIADYLDTQYKSSSQYYDAYRKINAVYINEAANAEGIERLTIYTDNPTLLTGGIFASIRSVEDKAWYHAYLASDRNVYLSCYNDPQEMGLFNGAYWRISIVRTLDYYGDKNILKIVKADLDYNELLKKLDDIPYEGQYYVCHNNVVLFSNADLSAGYHYTLLDNQIAQDAESAKEITLYGQTWDIYVNGLGFSYLEAITRQWAKILLLLMVNFLLPIFAIRGVSHSITNRMQLLTGRMRNVEGGTLEEIRINKTKDEIGMLIDQYNLMTGRMKRLIEDNYQNLIDRQELKIEKQQAELLALRSQINPHFIFNTMESIRMQSLIRGETVTADILGKLALLLRKVSDWSSNIVTLTEEMEYVQAYLDIQHYRFGPKFNYILEISPECNGLRLPKMTLVSFVENACVHGIEKSLREGTVTVRAVREGETCSVSILDDGVGMIAEKVEQVQDWMNHADISTLRSSGQIGIINACVRLRHYFGEGIRFSLESAPEQGTTVCISQIPREGKET
jgi:two-component system, sensor histidine kinase YesM